MKWYLRSSNATPTQVAAGTLGAELAGGPQLVPEGGLFRLTSPRCSPAPHVWYAERLTWPLHPLPPMMIASPRDFSYSWRRRGPRPERFGRSAMACSDVHSRG